jgi:hypothetical protein
MLRHTLSDGKLPNFNEKRKVLGERENIYVDNPLPLPDGNEY